MARIFVERSGGSEPSGRFGLDEAQWTRTYVLCDDSPNDAPPIETPELVDWIKRITGTTLAGPSTRPFGAPGGAGSLVRVMPMCDPQFFGLFADPPTVRVPPGEGYRPRPVSGDELLAVRPITHGYSGYTAYEFVIPFGARPYAVLPDERMVADALDWYDVDGSRKRLTYYPEWLRFTQPFVEDIDSRISATVGSAMQFLVPSNNPPGLDGAVYPGLPDMMIPDVQLKFRWYAVPLRYVMSSNSYLTRYKGFINQSGWVTPWGTFAKGSLLYLGPKTVRTYTPPQFQALPQGNTLLAGSFFAQPLVDLELSFIYTTRKRGTRQTTGGDLTGDPDSVPNEKRPNNNWVDGGHSLMPHFHSKTFHYAHAKTEPANDYARWQPQYRSAPLPHVLFQDPDVPGVIINL